VRCEVWGLDVLNLQILYSLVSGGGYMLKTKHMVKHMQIRKVICYVIPCTVVTVYYKIVKNIKV